MTPEDLLTRLRAELGDEVGGHAWMILDEALSGKKLYWPKRVRKALQARTVHQMRSNGRSWTAVCAALRVSRSTGIRLYRLECRRLRTMCQDLPKTESEAA